MEFTVEQIVWMVVGAFAVGAAGSSALSTAIATLITRARNGKDSETLRVILKEAVSEGIAPLGQEIQALRRDLTASQTQLAATTAETQRVVARILERVLQGGAQ